MVVVIIILLSIFFTLAKSLAYRSTPRLFRPVLHTLFEELSVLGFISLVVFLTTREWSGNSASLMAYVSEREFGDDEELLHLTEWAHYALFFIIVLYILSTSVNIYAGLRQSRKWTLLEGRLPTRKPRRLPFGRRPRGAMTRHEIELQAHPPEPVARQVTEDLNEYAALRIRFVQCSGLDEDFPFDEYRLATLGHTLAHLAEIFPSHWLFVLALCVCLFWLAETDEHARFWVMIAFGFLVALQLAVVHRKLKQIYLMILPQGRFGDNGDFAMVSPPFLDRPPASQRYRGLGGLLVSSRPPSRHEELFWFGPFGPTFMLWLLGAILLQQKFYYAAALVFVFDDEFHEDPLLVILSLVPIAAFVALSRPAINLAAVATSVEDLRNKRVIQDVLQRQRSQRATWALQTLIQLRYFAEKAHERAELADKPGTPKSSSFFSAAAAAGTTADDHRALFAAMDADKSGYLTKSEIGEMLDTLGMSVGHAELDTLMTLMDRDRNGHIDFDEFSEVLRFYQTSVIHASTHRSPEALVDMLFEVLDKDRSGKISVEEIHAVFRQLGDWDLADVVSFLRAVDKDGDNEIDPRELAIFIRSVEGF